MKTKRKPALGKVQKTSRGFELIEFTDLNDEKCSLQMSSLAGSVEPGTFAVWLGCDENKFHGVTKEPLSPRMHLNRKQANALIYHLRCWLLLDTFSEPEVTGTSPVVPTSLVPETSPEGPALSGVAVRST